MSTPPDTEVIATLTIRRAGEMTTKGRERVVEWLRAQALALSNDGKDYAPRFTARYHGRGEE
jgi:hypothetical protein